MGLKVKNRQSGVVTEATKNEDGTYIVEGKTLSREDMSKTYIPIKDKPKEEVVDASNVISGEFVIEGDIGKLAGALSKCQGEFSSVKKNSSANGMYNYADIEAVLKASMPITSKQGLSITQMNISKQVGKTTLVGVKTILMHEGGGYISSDIFLPTEKTKMNTLVQMAGVTSTYLRRYGIQSALGLATTDNDGRDD